MSEKFKTIPIPQGYSTREPRELTTTEQSASTTSIGTVAPPEKSKKLGESEVSFILRKNLFSTHSSDPTVMHFISSYLLCRSVPQAAKEAGISTREGHNLKARPDINEAIREVTEKAVLKHGYDAAEIIERAKEIASVDPVDFENPDGSFKEHMKDIPADSRRAIKSFKAKNIYETDPNGMKVVVGKLIEVQFWDKLKGIELLGREKDTFRETKRVEHTLAKNMSQTLLESKKRAEDAANEMREVGPVIEIAVVEVKE